MSQAILTQLQRFLAQLCIIAISAQNSPSAIAQLQSRAETLFSQRANISFPKRASELLTSRQIGSDSTLLQFNSSNRFRTLTAPPPNIAPIEPENELWGRFPIPRIYLIERLPQKLWFRASAETSQGLLTNTFSTYSHKKSDYLYTTSAGSTIGVDLYDGVNLFCDYGLGKDLYAAHRFLNFPTAQSIGFGVKQVLFKNPYEKGEQLANFNIEGREFWIDRGVKQFAITPSISYDHAFGVSTYEKQPLRGLKNGYFLNGTVSMPLISANPFSSVRNIIPKYSVRITKQALPYRYDIGAGLATNFPSMSRDGQRKGNAHLGSDFTVTRIWTKEMETFLSVQPSWNWSSHKRDGLSGFNFQLMTGVRFTVEKTPVNWFVRAKVEEDQVAALQLDSRRLLAEKKNNIITPTKLLLEKQKLQKRLLWRNQVADQLERINAPLTTAASPRLRLSSKKTTLMHFSQPRQEETKNRLKDAQQIIDQL